MRRLIGPCCLVATFLFSVSAFAQNPQSQTYGTQSEIVLSLPSTAFTPQDSTVTYSFGNGIRWVTNGGGVGLDAPVSLPSGASVIGIEVFGCDFSTTGRIVAFLEVCGANFACSRPTPYIVTDSLGTPGCQAFRSNFTTPVTVNSAANSYPVHFWNQGDTTGAVYFQAVRLYYKLQISPDPVTATFADVPVGHPFHRFVEALAAAGITGGCGSGNYCPDAPITRGQMAVFLAGALGLHWAP